MKLKEGEVILKEYYFSQTKETYNKGVLTDKRLICISKNSKDNENEENYPLSKLTSVRTEKEKNTFRSKVLGFSVILMLISLIITGVMIFSESEPNWNGVTFLIPIYLILIWLIRFGLKPDKVITNLVITQLGGTKRYSARDNKDLREFIELINEQLI
ncbi:MAG: PH domain-containing protein [Bizionia sp.]|nr:PH domain-containing protein [Bizionia sp.]